MNTMGTYALLNVPVDRPNLLRVRGRLQSRLRWFAARRFQRPIHWRTIYKPVYPEYAQSDPLMAIGSLGVRALTVRSWNIWRAALAWFKLIRRQ